MRIRKTLFMTNSEPVIVIMALLLVLGTLNIFSSSFVLAATDFKDPYFFVKRHALWLILGVGAFLLCQRINYQRWRYAMPFLLIFILVTLVLVLFIGPEVNGARRWISLGPLGFQPAELAKLFSVIVMSAYLAARIKAGKLASLFNRQILIILIMGVLIEKEPDMGTASIVVGVPLIMMGLTGLPKKQLYGLVGLVAAGIVGLIFLQPYRLERVKVLLDPWADAQGTGYQTVQSLSTIGSGGLFGMGLGAGVSKYEYLPEAHTDFAFAIFCQEQGFIGALIVILLFAALLLYCVRIAGRAYDEFGQMLALGVLTLIIGQAIANLFMVSGLFPVVGIPLPFISYGGSSLIVTMSAMGILLNVCEHGKSKKQMEALDPVTRPAPAAHPHLRRIK